MNKILVIDDERAILRAFERALEKDESNQVITAATAADGLAAVHELSLIHI